MDTAQWPQEVGLVKSMEGMVSSTTCSKPITTEKRARPPKDHAINCPRCNSTNTKFCYYNNYSLTQPRYFCKTCRRYWTEGGTLRNVPVGGGTRKNKRSSASSTNSKKIPDLTSPLNSSQSTSHQNPKIIHEVQDLNLAFRTSQDHYHNMSGFVELLPAGNENHMITSNPSSTASFSELLRSGGTISSRGLNPLMPMPLLDPNTAYPSGFGFHDHLRPPAFNFPLDHGLVAGGYGNMQDGLNDQVGAGKLMFPLEDVKPVPSTDFEQHRGQGDDASGGYWNGMLGGGGSW